MNYDLITDIEFFGVDFNDYPDFSDAYIVSAKYNGEQMNDEQISCIPPDIVYELLMKDLY